MNDKINQFTVIKRKTVTPEMLNINGTLFGGESMGWMDKVGHEVSINVTGRTMYTLSADKIKFLKPVFLGETVDVIGRVEQMGAVKLSVKMEVIADPNGPNRRNAVEGVFVFVELDENHRPHRIHYPSDIEI